MSAPVVVGVDRKGEKAAMIRFDVGQAAWSPDFEVASKLSAGKPLPKDWRVEQGEYGPKALPPRQGKGGGSYSQSKEAFDRSAESRLAWQHAEEERRDRRTALMQAVVVVSYLPYDDRKAIGNPGNQKTATDFADVFYAWLRKTSAPPAAGRGSGPESGADTTPSVLAPEGPSGTEKVPEATPAAPAGELPVAEPGEAKSDSPSGSSPGYRRNPETGRLEKVSA